MQHTSVIVNCHRVLGRLAVTRLVDTRFTNDVIDLDDVQFEDLTEDIFTSISI